MKKIITTISTLAIVLAMTACGSSAPASSEPADAGIDNAKDMFAASTEAMKDVKSMHVDMDFDMLIKMDMSEVEGASAFFGDTNVEMPVKMGMDMDVTEKNAKGSATYSSTMFGADSSMTADMYVDIVNGITYSKDSESEDWYKSEEDFDVKDLTMGLDQTEGIDEKYLESATFEETDTEYIVTLDAEAINSMDVTKEMEEMGLTGEDMPEYDISGGPVVYHFDKETNYLVKAELNDIKMAYTMDQDGQKITGDFTITAILDLSKIGEITDDDVAIPEDVIKNAKDDSEDVEVDLDELTDDIEEDE